MVKNLKDIKIDYKKLLIAYMCDVVDSEGTFFGTNMEYGRLPLNAKEIKALEECKIESNKYLDKNL